MKKTVFIVEEQRREKGEKEEKRIVRDAVRSWLERALAEKRD